MIKNKLLKDIYFGSELEKLRQGSASTQDIMKKSDPIFQELTARDWGRIENIVSGFFSKPLRGKFGGPITAGDAFFMAAFMSAMQPKGMLEVGVCSGVSSAFILYAADKLGLLKPGKTFLQSVDLLKYHGEEGHEVGRVVGMNYPSLAENWKLHTGTTTPELVFDSNDFKDAIDDLGATLAFIDANHMHPWPALDVLSISKLLPAQSWIMMQDVQLMERWLANCVELGVPSPKPCRGVNVSTLLWPGTKISGWDMCYNMSALKLDVANAQYEDFIGKVKTYPAETGEGQAQKCFSYLDRFDFTNGSIA
ncbi:MAG: class I SAM-dependent methyltransferase [Pseudomonadota bacterium]